MTTDEYFEKDMVIKSWEDLLDACFDGALHHLWRSLTDVEMTDVERLELFIAIVERLLREKHLVFAKPDPCLEYDEWHTYEDGFLHVWCADTPLIVRYLREYIPPLSHPNFRMEMISYGTCPPSAWLGRGKTISSGGIENYEAPMSLWTDGHCIANPEEWVWVHLDEFPDLPRWSKRYRIQSV
ncbi:hypothetical protein [Acidithiobacillus sp. AMEEHan]|uniref:hypothetical protein n=1 Tax=Acidithiobacillus sp. AMEEHan TaxID=2994951 RepID=UPI0027E552CB|nr:hypothetical protein [Acidithiobacillus sp. AMEEHan]